MSGDSRPPVTLLAIDDDPRSLELIQDALSREDLSICTAMDPKAGLELVHLRHPEIVLVDLIMPGMSGIDVLEEILKAAPATDVILITGHYSAESAVEAIRKGASDYLTKPVSIARLRERVDALIADYHRRQRAMQLDDEMLKTCQFEGMVGRSPLMLEVFSRIRRTAPHVKTALVTGATGTGKELVARALHRLGPAASGRYAVCNASAIVETLFESELFGHVKGAFTGAAQDKAGLFEYASGGTLFLDEIGDLPLNIQTKLLRVLETREFQRVGSPVSAQDRRARGGRHQPRPARHGGEETISGGLVLSPLDGGDPAAPPGRAPGGSPAARAPLHRPVLEGIREDDPLGHAARRHPVSPLRLAGEHPGARERTGPRVHDVRG